MVTARAETMIAYPTLVGEGPRRVMVLHEWTSDSRSYRLLRRHLDGRRFTWVFPDLRGYGRSKGVPGRYTFAEISRDCARLADHLGWDRFHLVGHSMTGAAAQRLALDHGARIQSMVAICPMSAAGSSAGDDAKAFFRQTVDDDEAFRRLVRFVAPDLPIACVDLKLRLHRRFVLSEAAYGYMDAFWNASFGAEVDGLETPTLVVVGDRDPGLDAAAMTPTFLAWHRDARVEEIPGCGHFPMLTEPRRLARLIGEFISTVQADSGG